ncbi:Phenylalanine--tRNA ligase alpha subunit [Candidatus Kinetoplastibacterium sorsogonicusi]|uniref:Phenylalanine--tRNA ligase alpha subunit n=1 Tax=Candidatus Kinetoplastidibacterium kentomonadis TaxID=1576550 RepID=A0A3S7J9Q6_9PROT|nr:phenylalanine--tRNA ligase subunit alpha [Candidatus Kinetoplastibacterium sorsogonicusi]AWD32400.1 Phenylalanine--tRNA ligase alpha subunit [Candidatus Kinetoplastibacterium sorsogonicusi]
MKKLFEELVSNANIEFNNTNDLVSLEQIKSKFLGKEGSVTKLLKNISKIKKEDRKQFGIYANSCKSQIENLLKNRRNHISNVYLNDKLNKEYIDVTLPGRGFLGGSIHPIMITWARIEKIFHSIGFDVADGPEIEDDWNNFTALNNPIDHPARSMQDTFYLDMNDNYGKKLLLRTHTSPMQVRYAKSHKPPIKVISPGRTYRVDNDSTHSPMFHQVEGLWISEDISFANLKFIYINFLRCFFEQENLDVRFRPSFFPFTEPSVEMDMMFKTGPNKGKWLEISGAGQVHPNVIRNFGLDPEKYMGFAFGSGLERLTMLRYGISDLRNFYEGDLRFLSQIK